MSKKTKETPKNEMEPCPKCGTEFSPAEHEVLECPRCGIDGSTKCCNTGGRHCVCNACEEGQDDDCE